jgi:hypothetical protein
MYQHSLPPHPFFSSLFRLQSEPAGVGAGSCLVLLSSSVPLLSSVFAFGFGFALPCLSLEKMRQALDKNFKGKGIKSQEKPNFLRVNHFCVDAKGKH